MSISEFFNKKARAAAAASAIALGAAGGYAGHQIAQHEFQPQQSNFVLSQLNDNSITEKQFIEGRLPGGAVVTQKETDAVRDFTTRIDAMAAEQNLYNFEQQKLATDAVSFVNALRVSPDISEQDYARLLKDYDSRVGLDVSATTGNYEKGIMYNQEANVAEQIQAMFNHDQTDEEVSRDVGDLMAQGQQMYDNAGLEGGLAGAAIGMLMLAPLFMRRKRPCFDK